MDSIFSILEIIRDSFSHHIIFSTGLLLIMGFIFGQVAERFKLPSITGYIIAGIITGRSFMDMITYENSELLKNMCEITLSIIAVSIGSEFSFAKLKAYGPKMVLLTFSQMFSAFFAVSFGLLLFDLPLYIAFLLGAIAAATAPAATVIIVEKLKARGPFVDYLYGIVALDDAGTIVLFSVVFAIISSTLGQKALDLQTTLYHVSFEIIISLIMGIAGAFITHFFIAKKSNRNEVLIISLGIVFVITSISISLQLSPLITNMALGFMLVNISRKNLKILKTFEPITPPLYAIFFAIAGTELDIKVFADMDIILISIAYVFFRAFGKYSGIFIPSAVMKLPGEIRKNLGLCLLPQAGVALGLILFIQASPLIAHSDANVQMEILKLVNIVLIAVFVHEMIGPPISKYAILKSLKRR